MEKTAQTPGSAPRRRRRRRSSGAAQNAAPAAPQREGGRPAAQQAPQKQRSRAPRKEPDAPQAAPHGRKRGQQPAAPQPQAQAAGRGKGRGHTAPAQEPARAPKPPRAARGAHRMVEEDPGLELITRRPPKQKFSNFEEYLAAHGGMTVPLPGEPDPAPADTAETQAPAGKSEV